MAKKKASKKKKKRAHKYEKKLAVGGTFGQLLRVSVGKKDEVKKELQEGKVK